MIQAIFTRHIVAVTFMLLRIWAINICLARLSLTIASKPPIRNVFRNPISLIDSIPSRSFFSALTPPNTLFQQVNASLPDGSGTATGIAYPQYGVDAFLGIPYADPPVGALRFNQPQALTPNLTRIFDASKYGVACLQATSDPSAVGEDCLSVNVVRPSGAPADAKLPVMVWIYGGTLTSGSSSAYNSSLLLIQSMMRGQPIISVSFNYRLGALGFLSSTDIALAAASGTASLNCGLYDMKLALQWVQNNIEGFGGGKDKVTVFGQSAGAMGIGSLLVADGGQAVSKLNLFRAVIMESGAPQGGQVYLPNATDTLYAAFINAAGCSSTPTLSCLRAASLESINTATNTAAASASIPYPYTRVIDGYFHDKTPSESVSAGRVAFVPIIAGNVLDEGTSAAPTNLEDEPSLEAYLAHYVVQGNFTTFLPSLNNALSLYPDNPAQGSPYDPIGASPTDRFYGPTNQYKRISSLLGDNYFQSGRRSLLQAYLRHQSLVPGYSYLFATNVPGTNPAQGVPHASELGFVYGAYAETDVTSDLGNTSLTMMNAWINFAWTLSPNGVNVPTWPKYGPNGQMLLINLTDYTVIPDDYRHDPMSFLSSAAWAIPLSI